MTFYMEPETDFVSHPTPDEMRPRVRVLLPYAPVHATQPGREYITGEARCVADPTDSNFRALYDAVLAFEMGKPSGLQQYDLAGRPVGEPVPMTSWEMRFPDPADDVEPIELIARYGIPRPKRRRRKARERG